MRYVDTSWENGDYNINAEDIKLNEIYSYEWDGEVFLYFYIRARGEENAKKIAYDLIAEYKAKNEGIA